METERTPLGNKNFPRYVLIGTRSSPKGKLATLKCCTCAVITALLVAILVFTLSYFLSSSLPGGKPSNSSAEALDGLLQSKWPLQEEKYFDVYEHFKNDTNVFETGAEGLREKDSIEELLPSVPIDSPEFRHQLATPTTKQAQEMSRLGYIINIATKEIRKSYGNDTNWNKNKMKRWIFSRSLMQPPIKETCKNFTIECNSSPYRTANGMCNNLENPTWGAALIPYRRILLPNYSDGISDPRKGSDGKYLPSARKVSLAIHRPVYRNDIRFTVMLAVWGQFIDHDITATAISKAKNGSPINCCQTKHTHPECFPVFIKAPDPFYLQRNITCMDFVRSAPAPTDTFGPREQLNQATSFLDGSVIYSNDEETMNQLRTFSGGKLKMLRTSAGDLLPISDDPNDGCNRKKEFERGRYCFLSGDNRSNENLLLTSMHLLFARQHNNIAKKLAKVNSHWTDEKLFQETRKIIAAQIQHITYNEFLPLVLPERLLTHLNLSTKSWGYSDFYNSSIDPTISNVFASAAFRFGHSLLPGLVRFLHHNATHEEYLELHKMLFNPFELYEAEFLENFIRGAINTSSAKSDVYFSQEITQKLFQKEPKSSCGLDLVSLNIQRGRDHGLPSYPNWRKICTLKEPKHFDDLKNDIDEDTLSELKKLYKSVDDLDLYTGGLAEKPVPGGLVGPTITCLLADQFLRMKMGDRYWYERMEKPQRYTLAQLNEIRKTTLAKIICQTSGVSESQAQVMRRAGPGNQRKPCESFSQPDFEAWKQNSKSSVSTKIEGNSSYNPN